LVLRNLPYRLGGLEVVLVCLRPRPGLYRAGSRLENLPLRPFRRRAVRRTGIPIANVFGMSLLVVSSLAVAQNLSQQPKAPTPDQMPGTRLIVWTETQRPHPVPDTSTEMHAASNEAQVLNGTIQIRGSALFFAGANHPAYRIENNREQIRTLAGKQVRIYGKVASGANVLYVLSITQL
jgi:hypothetical protein